LFDVPNKKYHLEDHDTVRVNIEMDLKKLLCDDSDEPSGSVTARKFLFQLNKNCCCSRKTLSHTVVTEYPENYECYEWPVHYLEMICDIFINVLYAFFFS
jgi:hypothetical protein